MAEKKQFDEFLGGSQSLPHEVSIMKVAAARASEIAAMTRMLENPIRNKLIFQKLPIYMRRRVMSHNAKRMPRRLREAHLSQMAKSGLSAKKKRPSRKYRRRPSNILAEYNRRQLKKIWLETHIWHAKRFHMIDKWGHRIANYPNDKCFRANYRAAMQYCLLQDISYYTCVEIKGQEDLLKTTLKAHCNPFMSTFAAIRYTNGRNEGTLMFFKKNSYPQFPIGNVHFLWRPKQSDIVTIWIWVHPSFYADFLSEIVSSFEFKENNAEEDATHVPGSLYTNDAGCKMTILRYKLNRFRLYGPATLSVLTDALQTPSFTESDLSQEMNSTRKQDDSLGNKTNITKESVDNEVLESVEKIAIDEANEEDAALPKTLNVEDLRNRTWHIEYYKHQENMEAFKVQKEMWQKMRTSNSRKVLDLLQSVMGLTILDPRFYLSKRTKREYETTFYQCILRAPANLHCTPIWDAQIRHTVSNTCVATYKINNLRSGCLVPGVANDKYFGEDIMAKIPILLIPRPECSAADIDSSVDIVIPSTWGLPIWLALVQRCVRTGALRESRQMAYESLNPNTPDVSDPDCPAYVSEALSRKEELTQKYFRYPPNGRVNFVKFGISSPFYCDWRKLMKDYADTEDFYVLRDIRLLLLLQASLKSRSRKIYARSSYTPVDLQDLNTHRNCLIRVQVSMKKGIPNEFAIICMPTPEDLERLGRDENWGGPVEQCHADPNEAARKVSRKNHLLRLKRLKRQSIRQKKLLKDNALNLLENSTDVLGKIVNLNSALRPKIITEQAKRMSEMYLPECTKVRYSCDREIMGYVTAGGFSFVRAKGMGVGFVTLPPLMEMINKKSKIVLVRNTKTRQYRPATLDVLGA
ncbi:PREDICTED: ribonucleases P/MRP protein subunit POP1 [Dinoponera quadriceps]|uniref:Ribonucleases P/MRP protein subunit POP1 n=1 Tax=Dinoponera quadriceps TaxID=609295 RepID=A0A6P3YDX4_DINQU|nr:PREDICTED: ribonucleases P/MRP protein subunit POP1 [Dinoponera quadriceps]XP_014489307.1 PREDICTED: ribonucleases P/MRP protein subunit POP1 [Dinoponera quadriceps]